MHLRLSATLTDMSTEASFHPSVAFSFMRVHIVYTLLFAIVIHSYSILSKQKGRHNAPEAAFLTCLSRVLIHELQFTRVMYVINTENGIPTITCIKFLNQHPVIG